MSNTHKCPKDGCSRQLPRHRLACRTHWYQVPIEIRSAVNAAWANFLDDPEHYMAVREQAVEAMNRGN